LTKAFAEAVARRPPRGIGPGAARRLAVSGTSTPALPLGFGDNSFFITIVSTQDAHIRFGASDVAAATATDWPLRAGQAEEFWCEANEDTHFTVIQDAVGGFVYWYRSSQ
jgi:hypothetical protein